MSTRSSAPAARIAELYGPIAGAAVPEAEVPQEPLQEGERRFELELEVQLPRMIAAFQKLTVADRKAFASEAKAGRERMRERMKKQMEMRSMQNTPA